MTRGYIAGCIVIVAAAALGYWVFSDKLPTYRPPPPTLMVQSTDDGLSGEKLEVYGTRGTGEVIDLARVFEPTGEELALHNLLHGDPVAELIPAPLHEAEPEMGPLPREEKRELLHAPQLVASHFPEAAEEESSTTTLPRAIPGPFMNAVAWLFAEWLNRSLPLKGRHLPGSLEHE